MYLFPDLVNPRLRKSCDPLGQAARTAVIDDSETARPSGPGNINIYVIDNKTVINHKLLFFGKKLLIFDYRKPTVPLPLVISYPIPLL